jgi:signal transduction histidine kinase
MKIPAFAFSFKPHSFPLLLKLEWILLGLSAFKLLSSQFFGIWNWEPPMPNWFKNTLLPPAQMVGLFGLLIVFALLGLRLPINRWSKFCYISLSFLVMGAMAYVQGQGQLQGQGGGIDISPLLIVLLLRGCLLFRQRGRWIIASFLWLSYSAISFAATGWLWVTWQSNYSIAIKDISKIPGLIVRDDGGIQWTLNLSLEQVNEVKQFVPYMQHIVGTFLVDGLFSSGLIVIFMLLLVDSLINESQGRKKLAVAHQQLYQYSLQIEDQATLQERTRIAREIHDSLGHLLTAQSVMLENTTMSLAVAEDVAVDARSFLDESQRLGREARRELRQAVWMLRSDPMQGKSLPQAIADLVQQFLQVTGICPVVLLDRHLTLPGRYQMVLYRILEEALTNIQKHSQATQVTIDLKLQTSEDEIPQIILNIIDNGTGFNPQQTRSGFGLQGMKERVESLSGTLEFEVQSGCCIMVHIPLLEVSV